MPALFNARSFAVTVDRARPGSRIVYYVGFLVVDADKNAEVGELGQMARHLSNSSLPLLPDQSSMQYGMGVGTLVQRKLGDRLYEYIFMKRR